MGGGGKRRCHPGSEERAYQWDGKTNGSLSLLCGFLCRNFLQVALLLSTSLTATLAVAREQRVASAKRDKAASDEKVCDDYRSTLCYFLCPPVLYGVFVLPHNCLSVGLSVHMYLSVCLYLCIRRILLCKR